MDMAEDEEGKLYYYIHWIDVASDDPAQAGESIKGTLEKWVRRIRETVPYTAATEGVLFLRAL
jgi:multisubunit Na+/H+ antiporter MnhE subunit